jgi:urease accessory protein
MKKSIPTVIILLSFPILLIAHDGHGSSFMSGLSHPILGLDHLLAMLSVGILSAQMGEKAMWAVPAVFVGVMLFGGLMGIGSEGIPFIEPVIALSVIALGIAIAFEEKLPLMVTIAFVGFFGFNHGFAHGMEMPQLAHAIQYSIGFILGATIIHLIGVAIGYLATKTEKNSKVLQFIGAFIAGMGLHILIG